MRPNDSKDGLAPIVELHDGEQVHADALLEALRDELPTKEATDHGELIDRLSHALPQPPPLLRSIVAALATAQLLLVLPWLIAEDPFGLLGDSNGSHLTRDGALGLAVAVAALLTAWRPRYALPSFILASAALIAQTITGLVEHADIAGVNEFIHLPSVALACLTGLCGIRLTDLKPRR